MKDKKSLRDRNRKSSWTFNGLLMAVGGKLQSKSAPTHPCFPMAFTKCSEVITQILGTEQQSWERSPRVCRSSQVHNCIRRKLRGIPLTLLAFRESTAVALQRLRTEQQGREKFSKVHKASNMTGKQRELPRNIYLAAGLETELSMVCEAGG